MLKENKVAHINEWNLEQTFWHLISFSEICDILFYSTFLFINSLWFLIMVYMWMTYNYLE